MPTAKPDALDTLLAGVLRIDYDYPAWYARPEVRAQHDRLLALIIDLRASVGPRRVERSSGATASGTAIDCIRTGLLEIAKHYPELCDSPAIREQIATAVESLTNLKASMDRPPGHGFIMLDLDRLLHRPSEN
jgi:hypothetical protein